MRMSDAKMAVAAIDALNTLPAAKTMAAAIDALNTLPDVKTMRMMVRDMPDLRGGSD